MRRRLFIGLAVTAAIVLLPAPVLHKVPQTFLAHYGVDSRVEILQRFFGNADCPAEDLAGDFVDAADKYGLDWRLLPSISLIESTAGKTAPNNNLFGWNNGNTAFASLSDGIYHVAWRLARSRLYKDKSLDEMLEMYNPISGYSARVKSIMQRIAPSEGQD
jgi:hypothetical protein